MTGPGDQHVLRDVILVGPIVLDPAYTPPWPTPYYPIDPDAPIFGCNRLGHSWDENGDCRHCPASVEDLIEGFRP